MLSKVESGSRHVYSCLDAIMETSAVASNTRSNMDLEVDAITQGVSELAIDDDMESSDEAEPVTSAPIIAARTAPLSDSDKAALWGAWEATLGQSGVNPMRARWAIIKATERVLKGIGRKNACELNMARLFMYAYRTLSWHEPAKNLWDCITTPIDQRIHLQWSRTRLHIRHELLMPKYGIDCGLMAFHTVALFSRLTTRTTNWASPRWSISAIAPLVSSPDRLSSYCSTATFNSGHYSPDAPTTMRIVNSGRTETAIQLGTTCEFIEHMGDDFTSPFYCDGRDHVGRRIRLGEETLYESRNDQPTLGPMLDDTSVNYDRALQAAWDEVTRW